MCCGTRHSGVRALVRTTHWAALLWFQIIWPLPAPQLRHHSIPFLGRIFLVFLSGPLVLLSAPVWTLSQSLVACDTHTTQKPKHSNMKWVALFCNRHQACTKKGGVRYFKHQNGFATFATVSEMHVHSRPDLRAVSGAPLLSGTEIV